MFWLPFSNQPFTLAQVSVTFYGFMHLWLSHFLFFLSFLHDLYRSSDIAFHTSLLAPRQIVNLITLHGAARFATQHFNACVFSNVLTSSSGNSLP